MAERAYMAYSRHAGPEEGACLVFAADEAEARTLAFPVVDGWWDCSGYWDCEPPVVAIVPLQGDCAHMREREGPHVVESPPTCADCERWGADPLNARGLCATCQEAADDEAACEARENAD